MTWRQLLLTLVVVIFSQAAFGQEKDPVCGIFKRVVKVNSPSPNGTVLDISHTGYVFMADGTGYIYYWDNLSQKTTGGPDITWERIGRGEYRYHRSWEETRWDGKRITMHQSHPFALSDDGDRLHSPDEPPHREVPTFYRVK